MIRSTEIANHIIAVLFAGGYMVGLALLLASCTEPRFVDTACTAFTPITYSAANDTEATKSQIRGHNAAWGKLCGK